ncbi:hypothetical protein FJV41_08690 [Myxococcus llanfairpwllgwyngyllgogerychwyrndrobwllllantysiliogogogochensis]|uniref:Uncharacterized protein n=1 Tax=Myxococcus llanfairpwllgwyngyllgogerychwyrndrobwllllantysiliogogogochensis TaxID=2590453 RepID=A0A540X5B0_9BACT|nr:hypothetical protein [Myxococcus llanfairpwllgwyngyllgogerychwyrndrobwllllantysiliogogogochensis]TQF16423.1 hypothetical protein FJV41_08690 [Myxococcus llanfairpwllgwyngyllgogerychwyrndrobwllllantysiliogogogochensis]
MRERPNDPEDYEGLGYVASVTLEVRETWKGSVRTGERVETFILSASPCDTNVQVGLTVVALLNKEDGQWVPVWPFCGTRFAASDSDVAAYRRVITAARQALDRWIQARLAGETPDFEEAHSDWRVLAAIHPVTRWDGVSGLGSEEFDAVHSFYDPRAPPDRSRVQGYRDELARDVVAYPSFDNTFALLLKLLRGFPNKDVDRVVANVLETVVTENPPPHWAIFAFDLLRERMGEHPSPRPRWSYSSEKSFSEIEAGNAQDFVREWPDFKQRHGLKPQPIQPPAK